MKKTKSQSNTETSENKPGERKESFVSLQLKEFLAFERTCGTLTSGYIQLLSFSLVMHTFLGYLLLSNHFLSPYARQLVDALHNSPIAYRLLQILIYWLNLLLLLSLFGAKLRYKTSIWHASVKRVVSLYTLLAHISLLFTTLILYLNLSENIPALLLALAVSLVDLLFLSNHCVKKEENYQSSHPLSLILRVGAIVHLVTNCLIVQLGTLPAFCSCAAVFGGLTLVWHTLGGCQLYFQRVSRVILLFFCGFMIAGSLLYLLLIRPVKPGASFNFFEFLAALAVVLFYLYSYEQRKRFRFSSARQLIAEKRSIKDYELNLDILLEQSDWSRDKECLLIGIMAHSAKTCEDPQYWSQQALIYDPITKRTFSPKSLVRQKDSAVRFYLKWVYSKALSQNKSKQLMLDYVEFTISEMADFSTQCFLLGQLESQHTLGFLEKVKLYKLKLILQEQSEAFNKLIFGGKIELDEVLHAEETFDLILADISHYCQRSVEVWTGTMQREVDVFELKQQLQRNFQLIPQINERWNSISKFLGIQKKWKYAYLNFALYLKNQKIKNKDLSLNNFPDNHASSESTPLSRENKRQQILPEAVYFDQNTAIIMCDLEEGQLRFSRVSKSFEVVTGYGEQEVRGSCLEMLLPLGMRQGKHDRRVVEWMEGGQTTDENSYYIKYTHFVNRYGEEVPALVIFKLYIDLLASDGLLKFMSLVKKEQKEGGSIRNDSELTYNRKNSATLFNVLEQDNGESESLTTLGLNPANNIFLKEDNLQPSPTIHEVERVKHVMRLLTLALIVMLLALAANMKSSMEHLEELARSQIVFCYLYKTPVNLASFNHQLLLGIGDSGFVEMLMGQHYTELAGYEADLLTKQVLFNSQLNLPNRYPPSLNSTVNQGIVYDNIDIFYLVMSTLATLSKPGANRTGHDSQMLNSYIKPGYDTMMNSAQQQLHAQLQAGLARLKQTQVIIVASLSLVLVMAGVYLCLKIYSYFSNMQEAIDIIVQFNNTEIGKIVDYWQKVAHHFRRMDRTQRALGNQDLVMQTTFRERSEEEDLEQEPNTRAQASLNQKHRNLLVTPREKRKVYKTYALTVLLLVLFIPTILTIQIMNLHRMSELMMFERAGYLLIDYYPATQMMDYALVDRAYHNEYNLTFSSDRFRDTLATIQVIIDYSQLEDIDTDSQYYLKQKNYLFGNPCTYNPSLPAKMNITYCATMANRTFVNGISSYLRHILPQLAQFLQGDTTLPAGQLYELSQGLALATFYLKDAITTWNDEFSQLIQDLQSRNVLLSVIISVLLLVLHVLVFELVVLAGLRESYCFMQLVFVACVPEPILTKEKTVKHRFYQSGILAAS